uniref:Integrase catalytic domain-containing protein n=1 Tax=Trichuris muris TaxID=70415 RepID=A0A5S6QMD2_TRIMR
MPSVCISDNGTNFVAGQRKLSEGVQRLNSTHVKEYMVRKGVKWQFNPPGAPHFGGTWERLIRSAKRALSAALNGLHLTDEILQTVVVEVEGLLNGRPLTHVSHHPHDPEPLSPNHFLLGRPYAMIPPDVFHPKELTSRRYWRAAQAIVDQFWRHWIREYLPTLNKGRAERSTQQNIQIGDIVLIVDISSPRGIWKMGRVETLYPGQDGVVRVVDIRNSSGMFRRPASRLIKLTSTAMDTSESAREDVVA